MNRMPAADLLPIPEHATRTLKGTLARPLAADLRRPWEKQPDPARPLSPGRVRRGFRNIRPGIGTPARVPKPGAGP
jgi:hypothetical protein